MGTVRLREGSPYYQYQYRYRGKLVRGSTKETNKRKALDVMKLKEADALQGVPLHRYERTTFDHLKEAVITDSEHKGNKNIKQTKKHLETLGTFFDVPVMDIDAKMITRYKKKRLKDGLAGSSINREMAELRKGLNLLCEMDMIGKAPRVKLFPENNARQVFLTIQEYQGFITALSETAPYFVPVCELAIITGWRKSSLLKLCWEHVDQENMVIRCPGELTKTGQPVCYFYANDDLIKNMIDTLWQNRKDGIPYIFLNKYGTGRIKGFETAWNKAVLKSKVADGGYNSKEKKTFKFHDLRRSALVCNEEAGISRTVAMEQAGIKSSRIYERYTIVDRTRLEKAVEKRQAYMDKVNQKKPFNEVEEEAKAFRKS